MEFWKFRHLFAKEELYFRRTDLFKDDDPRDALPSDEYAREALGFHRGKGKETGLVVLTTFDKLKVQLAAMLDLIFVGVVKYSEAGTTGYNLIQFLSTKRACFEKEKELRMLLQCHYPVAGMNRPYNAKSFPNREPLDEKPASSMGLSQQTEPHIG